MILALAAAGLLGLHADVDGVLSAELGAQTARGIVHWERAEPERGRYDWARLDEIVRGRQSVGIRSDAVSLLPTSRWGGCDEANRRMERRPPPPFYDCMPRDMDAWLAFVSRIVERYDGDGKDDMPGLTIPIKYWQVHNEWLHQWIGTDEEFFRLHRRTAAAIRKADPKAKIVASAITAPEVYAAMDGYVRGPVLFQDGPPRGGELEPRELSADQLRKAPRARLQREKALAYLGLCADYDVADVHFYGQLESLAGSLRWVRARVRERCGADKPVWMLEAASPFFRFSEERFLNDVVELHEIAFREGVEAVFWSSLYPTRGWPENFLRLSLVDEKGARKPAFHAYRRMARRLRRKPS